MALKHLLLTEKITICIMEYSLNVKCTHPCLSGIEAYYLGKIVSDNLHEHQLVPFLHQAQSDEVEVNPLTSSTGHLCLCCVQQHAAPTPASPHLTACDIVLQPPWRMPQYWTIWTP